MQLEPKYRETFPLVPRIGQAPPACSAIVWSAAMNPWHRKESCYRLDG